MGKRLTDKHPTYQKLVQLERLADELGLSLEWDGYRLWVTDTATSKSYVYLDQDTGQVLTEWPSMCCWKLYTDDEDAPQSHKKSKQA